MRGPIKKTLLIIFLFYLHSPSFAQDSPIKMKLTEEGVPVLDLTMKYPVKEVVLQQIADIHYIPLQSTGMVPVEGSRCYYYSETTIVTGNKAEGDIFIFNSKEGKLRSRFNRKGDKDNQYSLMQGVVYDEKAKEIYVLDNYNRSILVYTEKGEFIRALSEVTGINIEKIYNYDDESLFIVDRDSDNPYLFISKEDGATILRLETNYPPTRSNTISRVMEQGYTATVTIPVDGSSVKSGEELILTDLNSDTVSVYLKGGEMRPLFIKTPSTADEDYLYSLTLNMKYNNNLSLSISDYSQTANTGNIGDRRTLTLDLASNEVYIARVINEDAPQGGVGYYRRENDYAQANISTVFASSYILMKLLSEDKLRGELKLVAERLKENDNPVLIVVKYH